MTPRDPSDPPKPPIARGLFFGLPRDPDEAAEYIRKAVRSAEYQAQLDAAEDDGVRH
jgi:hypothetical protein